MVWRERGLGGATVTGTGSALLGSDTTTAALESGFDITGDPTRSRTPR